MSWTANSDFDQQLFTRLVQIRLRLSRERGCLPYQILSDADLKEMAVSKPTSLFKCLTLSGVSLLHMLRQAKPFIEEIKLWVETH